MKSLIIFIICLFSTVISTAQLKQIDIGNATLHYQEAGTGKAVVFIHGSLADYRGWQPYLDYYSKDFRAISYSRRFNYPNTNIDAGINYSAETEADDLAAFVNKLSLGKIHV